MTDKKILTLGSRWGFFICNCEHVGEQASDYFNLIGQLF